MTVVFAALLACSAARSGISQTTVKIEFNRDIRPILSDHCSRCHGPDKGNRKAKLRLDMREVALEKKAFIPGKPDESELIRRINTTDQDDLMPPPEMHKPLSPAEKNLLRRWIAEGAEYQPHWAYIPPKRAPIPKATVGKSEIKNPIDAFVRYKLETKKIKPSPEAERRTLLRRLSLDLIGLPPTPKELDEFANDQSPGAYEKQVDRLLASPHYGERMAAPWLDLARYADTVGYHGDQNQNVFPYRDYVINSFNTDKPFDQFTIEQLAGDLLPNPTDEQKTATCFNRLNMVTREGGAQPKEYLAKYAADRVRTVSTTWLGSTMGCCECHDHKFDPFSTKDFYSMAAFFADIKQWGVYADYSYTPNPDLRGFGNDHPFPPEIEVNSPTLQRRIGKLDRRLTDEKNSTWKKLSAEKSVRAAFNAWRSESRDFLKKSPNGWFSPAPEVLLKLKNTNAVVATNFNVAADNAIHFSHEAHESTAVKIALTNQWLAAIRLQIVPNESEEAAAAKAKRKPKRSPSDITLSAALHSSGKDLKLAFHFADADSKQTRYSMGQAVLGVKDVWKISTEKEQQTAVWQLENPVQITGNATLTVNFGSAEVASLRVSVTPFAADNVLEAGGSDALRHALNRVALFRSKAETTQLERAFLLSTDVAPEFLTHAHALQKEIVECRDGRAFVQVVEAREPMTMRVLPRGNWQDESGEIVQPMPPHFLPQLPNPDHHRLTRLDLAKWLVSPENPLTARTFVNRLWKQFFGAGLSAVVDDLGAQGEWPTHPKLLDWLAVEFRESGWDVKHMVKLMVMSATYRQAAGPRQDLKEIDPNNHLLACQSPRRLEAELVRDNALAISGLLNPEIGGPSVHPYQPPGYYANLQFPNRDYYPDKDERQYRRGVYAWWQRTFLQPMLANFDAPSREECTAARNISNTPQQALTELNDPTFVEASRILAAKVVVADAASDEQRVNLLYQRALARSPKPAEVKSLEGFLAGQRNYYDANPDDAKKLLKVGLAQEPNVASEPELAAWTQVCRVVLNLHETITLY